MATRRVIGNREEILNQRQELTQWENHINTIADKTEAELMVWFNEHFSGLTGSVRTGLEAIVRVVWANAKVTKKLWQRK